MFKPAWHVVSAFALMVAAACGGGDDGNGPTGSISVSASPATLTLPQGGTGTVTVTLTRGGGFSEAVSVTAEGLPAGVSANVSPAQLTGVTTMATVTVNVANTVAAGTYTATIRASATGVGAATATYSLTVTALPNYSLSATPTAVSVGQGASGTTTIGIQRTNFTSPVTLTLDNPPAGITGSFTPTPATADQSTLTINVASSVAPGNYTVTVKGSATGPGDRTATVALTVTAAASFTISASPNAVAVAPGGGSSSTIAIVRTNFTTDVALTLVSPPAGITGVFTPATLTGTTLLSSSLAINVAATVQPGTYTLTVRGAGGALTQTTPIAVTVAASSVTLSMTPTSLSIQQGGSSQATLNAARVNYAGDITPSVTGNPAGMTVTFNPNPLMANTSTVTINVGASVATGPHTLTITGASGAAGNPTTTLTVNVTAPSSGSIVWEFCDTAAIPLKFWRQSGGTWAEVSPTVVGNVTRFAFDISSTLGGIAFTISNSSFSVRSSLRTMSSKTRIQQDTRQARQAAMAARARVTGQFDAGLTNPFFDTLVMLGLATELQAGARKCATATTPVSKTFTVSGMGASETGALGYGPGSASLSPNTPSYNVMVPPGTYDWMAAVGTQGSIFDPTVNWAAYRIGRGETAPGGSIPINRTGAPAFVTMPFTVTGGNSGSYYTYVQNLEGARGDILGLPVGNPIGMTPSGNMLFIQPNDRLPTDMNWFVASNTEFFGTNNVNSRTTLLYFGSAPPASATFALPAAVPPFTTSQVMGAPLPTWTVSGPTPTDYQTAASIVEVSYVGAGESTLFTVSVTRGWMTANNMTTSYALTGPTLPNFNAQWAPAAPLFDAQVIMFGSNATSAPVAGTISNIAVRYVSPP